MKLLKRKHLLAVAVVLASALPVSARDVTFSQFVEEAGFKKLSPAVQSGVDALSDKSNKEKQQEGLEKLKKLAESGNLEAQLVLARIYKKAEFGVGKDIKSAVHWMTKAAEGGNSFAQALISAFYWNNASQKDPEKAFYWAKKSYAQKDRAGALALGLIYMTGIPAKKGADQNVVVEQDTQKAVECFTVASDAGLEVADHMLTVIYGNGFGNVKKDMDKCFDYAKKGATRGDTACMVTLGKMYYQGVAVDQNPKAGVEWLEKAVEKPDCEKGIASMLGVFYMTGSRIPQDYEKARKYFEIAAKQGSVTALTNLGNIYITGKGVEKDDKKGIEYWEKAAAAGDQLAMTNLGILLVQGVVVDKDVDKGLKLLKQAATSKKEEKLISDEAIKKSNDPLNELSSISAKAALNLGFVYRDGVDGVEPDAKEALKWFEIADKEGSVVAKSNLGTIYVNGMGVEKDLKKGIAFMRAAAEKGDAVSQYNLGKLYESGAGEFVEKDKKKALEWLKKSADNDYPAAQRVVGEYYLLGDYTPKDVDAAIKYFEKATKAGDDLAKVNLGVFYLKGTGVEKDTEKGLAMLKEIVSKPYVPSKSPRASAYYHLTEEGRDLVNVDDYCADALASCDLGLLYKTGDSVEQDHKLALKYFRRAAKSGHALAYLNIGLLLLLSDDVKGDPKEALAMIEKAADSGLDRAKYVLYMIYRDGEGVEKDPEKALVWLKKAADSGFDKAVFNLAYSYYQGEGAPKDLEKARAYFEKSAKLGNDAGKTTLGIFYLRGWGGDKRIDDGIALLKEVADRPFVKSEKPMQREIAFKDGEKLIKYKVSDFTPDSRAAFTLGMLYKDDTIAPSDEKQAIKYFSRAAQRGDSLAMAELSTFYRKGQGTEKDLTKMLDLTTRAAEGGVNFAQFNLGLCYEEGLGTEKDLDKARSWYKKALDNGYERASVALARLDKEGPSGSDAETEAVDKPSSDSESDSGAESESDKK